MRTHKSLTNWLSILAVAIFLAVTPDAAASTSQDQQDGQPKRYERRPPPQSKLTNEQVATLSNAWETARNPKILVTVGVANNRSVDFADRSEAVARLEGVVVGQLARAFPGAVVDLAASRRNNDRVLDAMRYNVDEKEAKDIDKVLRDRFNADVRLDITLRSNGGALVTEAFAVRDLDAGAFIGGRTLNEGDVRRTGLDLVMGTYICGEFIDPFVAWANQKVWTYTIVAMSQLSGGDGFERQMRRFSRTIERELGPDVKWAEAETQEREGVLYTTYEVRYEGELDDLLYDIEDYVLTDQPIGWDIVFQEGKQAGVFAYSAERPEWHILTDPSEPQAQDAVRARKAATRGSRLGIIVGSEFDEPLGYFSDPNTAPSFDIDDAVLRASLVNTFSDLGFNVVADDVLREQLGSYLRNAERYDNAPHMLESIGDLSGVDYVLHVNRAQDGEGGGRFIARMFTPTGARELGQQAWPDPAASRMRGYRVDPKRTDEIARFVAGRITERMDRMVQERISTTSVRVLNAPSAQSILRISQIFTQSVRGVRTTQNVRISTPAASFDVLYEGSESSLVLQAIEQIGAAFPGIEAQVLNGALVLNMNPVVLDEEAVATVRARRVALEPDEVEEVPPAPTVPAAIQSEQDRVVEALRDARGSVWLIEVQLADGRGWYGTGWTVSENLIATNAHVVGDVPERLARGEDVKVYGYSDSDLSERIVLGRAHRHPQWSMDSSSNEDFFFDVGAFEIVDGDPGRPLPVASADALDDLVAPVIVGYVGFPSDGVIRVSRDDIQNKQAHIGQANAIVEFSKSNQNGVRDMLVMHNLKTSKGASGSPIIGPDGRVVAVHNSGSTFRIESRSSDPSASTTMRVKSGFQGAVRIDVLTRFLQSLGIEIDE